MPEFLALFVHHSIHADDFEYRVDPESVHFFHQVEIAKGNYRSPQEECDHTQHLDPKKAKSPSENKSSVLIKDAH
jgi:hypothetical protein